MANARHEEVERHTNTNFTTSACRAAPGACYQMRVPLAGRLCRSSFVTSIRPLGHGEWEVLFLNRPNYYLFPRYLAFNSRLKHKKYPQSESVVNRFYFPASNGKQKLPEFLPLQWVRIRWFRCTQLRDNNDFDHVETTLFPVLRAFVRVIGDDYAWTTVR